jgi:acetylornithine aminotransferase
MSAVMHTYSRQAVAFERGEGALLFDTQGKQYLDGISGVAVCGLGHAHPAVTEAISKQAATLSHTSNLFQIDIQEKLANRLCEISGMDAVFFGNSGAEANEAAIKIARKYGNTVRKTANPSIIVMDGSFHGRTMATLSATGNRAIQAGFEPLVSGFVRAPFDDLEAVRTIAKNNQNVVAILVEPVQGEGGVNPASEGYLTGLREICDEQGWLLMLDEIQTGAGRTGAFFAYQHEGVLPDVVTLAKGLGNGVPIGACFAQGQAAEILQPGNHGSTFGGNLLACAAALATVNTMEEENLYQRAADLGARFAAGFQPLLDNGQIEEIRIKGLMIGLELAHNCGELVAKALDAGIILNVTAGKVVRLLPPLILSDAQADELIEKTSRLISDFVSAAAQD